MKKSRKDNRGRVLNCGEIYIANEDRYRFSYTDRYGNRYNAFAVLIGTGLRCGEFIGLRWEDFALMPYVQD